MRPLSKSTRSAAAAPRPAPAPRAQNAKNEAFGRVVPAFSRANAGWRIGPECAPPRRGQPRGASSTRAQHPAARAGGPVPARDSVSPSVNLQRALGRSATHPARSRRHLRPRRAFFHLAGQPACSTCSTFLSAFFPTAFFFFFSAESRARRATSPETDLFSSHARLSPQRGRERRRLLDARARAASVRGRG